MIYPSTMRSGPPAPICLTYDNPSGLRLVWVCMEGCGWGEKYLPPYMYPWNFWIAVSAVSMASNWTTPIPRDRPDGSYPISARSTFPMVVNNSIRS